MNTTTSTDLYVTERFLDGPAARYGTGPADTAPLSEAEYARMSETASEARGRHAHAAAARELSLPSAVADAGGLAAGSPTVAHVAAALLARDEPGWSVKQTTNQRNVFGFIEELLVYRTPTADVPANVAQMMRSRLELPGVSAGEPIHVALLTSFDLRQALETRRTTDRRTALLNAQAQERYVSTLASYLLKVPAWEARGRSGRAPKRPEAPVLRRPAQAVSERTYAVFAQALARVVGYVDYTDAFGRESPWRVMELADQVSAAR